MSVRVWERRRTAVLTAAAALSLVGSVALSSAPATAAPTTAPAASADTAPPPGGTYVPVTPSRILDTRSGLGAPKGATTGLTLTVAGRGGVPATGVGAVVLNLTVTAPVSDGWLSVAAHPLVNFSNVNFRGGQDVAQLAVSQVATDGTVTLTANLRTQVIADVVGWFTDADHADAGDSFTPVTTPVRAFDSRLTGSGGALRNGRARTMALPNRPAGATAVMINLTAIQPDHQSYLSAWPGGTWTGTSTMNVAPGDIRSNRAIVPIGPDGTISLVTNALSLDVVVDVNGWFGGKTGGYFIAGGFRILDSRAETGHLDTLNVSDVVGNTAVALAGHSGLPRPDSMSQLVGVWTSTTVVSPGSTGWTAFTPSQGTLSRPPVVSSDVNWGPGATPNVSVLTPGVDGKTKITSMFGPAATGSASARVELVVDLGGYFVTRAPASVPGLWVQDNAMGPDGPGGSDEWNHAVPGDPGDVVAVASQPYGRTTVLDRDGTVLDMPTGPGTSPISVDRGATAIASGGFGLFVLHGDGTVWTDSTAPGSRGVEAVPTGGYGLVAGVSAATAIYVSDTTAWAAHADGSLTGWSADRRPSSPPDLRGPVRTLGTGAAGRQCTAYTDGSVDVLDYDGTRALASDLGAVSVAAASRLYRCYALDAAGRVSALDRTAAGGVTVTAVPGPTAALLITPNTHVWLSGATPGPDIRALGTDGVVRDLVDGGWVVEPGLAGATALAGGDQLLTYVPPAG